MAKKAAKTKAKLKTRAGKLASAKVLPFKPALASAKAKPAVRPAKQVDKKSTFAELGTSLFPNMVVSNANVNTPGVAFTSRFANTVIKWPYTADGAQAFVPDIHLTRRYSDGSSATEVLTPASAAQVCAALAVAMSELEIQCPKNAGLSGKHWTLLVQRMRELKMIDIDMPEEYIAEPGVDDDGN